MSEPTIDERPWDPAWKRKGELMEKIIALLAESGPEAALPYAEELAELIGEVEDEKNRFAWCLVWEARGRLDKAIEIADRDAQHQLSEIEATASESVGEPWFTELVVDLLDAYYLQASRYLEIGIPGAAKAMMLAARELSFRFDVPFDEALQERYDDLCGEDET